MIVEIISIGTELILGDLLDTNAAYIAQKITASGFNIHYMTTVGDNRDRMVDTLARAIKRSELIITTGGLGPTDDDLTREAIAESTGCPLQEEPELLQHLVNYFKQRNYQMTANNRKQVLLPEGARVIKNQLGTAPGILLEKKDYTIIAMPGVPGEMQAMLTAEVIPYLKKYSKDLIKSRVIKFFMIGESALETQLQDILERQTNPTMALLAGRGEVKLRITAKASSAQKANLLLDRAEEMIRERTAQYIYSNNDQDLAEVVGRLLEKKGLTLALAESCTGGLLGNRITDIPGSSAYFIGGLVTYSNQSKIEQLGVQVLTLEKYGAVSRESVAEMAEGVRNKMSSDLGLSISGIAGPGGGNEEKPVGLIFIALADREKTVTYRLKLHRDRIWNKWMSSQYALYYLYQYLTKI